MSNMANEDKDFLLKLPKNLHDEYKTEKKSLINENNAKWSTDYHTAKKHEGIRLDKYHSEILNACIFPFVQHNRITQELNYAYIKSSPLSELDVKNVDFLIASEADDVLIFGEAKGKITNPSAVITEYKKRIKVIEENFAYIKQKFSGIESFEYVLGIPSGNAMETAKAIQRSSAHIVLWQISTWHDDTLSLTVLPIDDETERQKILHANNDLNQILLNGIPTSTAFKTFYHESHPVAKMTVLTSIDKGSKNFTFDDLQTSVSEELDNTPNDETSKIAKQIMDWAINIGFVKHIDGETYKIQSKFKHSGARYEELKIKWVKRKIEIEKEFDLNQKLEKLQNELLSHHAPLDNFSDS